MMMVDESLSAFIKEFIFIGTAAVTGSVLPSNPYGYGSWIWSIREPLLLAIIIGASVAETTALAQSLRVYEKFKD